MVAKDQLCRECEKFYLMAFQIVKVLGKLKVSIRYN